MSGLSFTISQTRLNDLKRGGLYFIEDLLVVSPWVLTLDHCQRFASIFDEDGNGVITQDEFLLFCQFFALMSHLEAKEIHRPADGSVLQKPPLDDEHGVSFTYRHIYNYIYRYIPRR